MRCVPGGTSTLCKPSTAHLQIIRQSLRGTGTHTFFSPSLSLCISLSHCTVQLLDSTQDAECHLRGKSSLSPLRAPLICKVGWSSSKSSGAHLSLGASLSVLLSVCVWGRVRREKEGRGLGGWPNQRGRDQKVNLHIWPQEQLQAEDDKLHTVTAHSQSGCYTCHANPVQICTGLAFTVMFKVYVCVCVCVCIEGGGHSALWAKTAILASSGQSAKSSVFASFLYLSRLYWKKHV